jgi:DNA-binding NarL/FixJ family response regulator
MPATNPISTRTRRGSIAVLLADDHTVLRDCLAGLLGHEEDFKVVAAVSDGESAVREAERLHPRVVVLGSGLGSMSGVDAARVFAQKVPGVAVVLLAAHSAPAAVRRALEAGVLGCLGRESSGEEVVKAIRAAAAGKRYLGESVAEKFVDEGRPAARGELQIETLTGTERNILRLVSEGKSNAEVAEMIGLSARTVETYRLRMMRKLGIGNLASLVKYAIRQGITTLD